MTPLQTKLSVALAFDEAQEVAAIKELWADKQPFEISPQYLAGCRREFVRLAPLHLLLIEAVGALETVNKWITEQERSIKEYGFGEDDFENPKHEIKQALTKLRAQVGEIACNNASNPVNQSTNNQGA